MDNLKNNFLCKFQKLMRNFPEVFVQSTNISLNISPTPVSFDSYTCLKLKLIRLIAFRKAEALRIESACILFYSLV